MILLNDGTYHKIGEPFTPDIWTIAKALSHVNRFNGHFGAYSVAQHSILVASQLPPDLQLAGLLHDASEAYIGDVVSPLKAHLPEYKELEEKYHDIIDRHFVVDTRNPLVKRADLRMLITEAKSFGADVTNGVWPDVKPYNFKIDRLEPWQAEKAFLDMFHGLTA